MLPIRRLLARHLVGIQLPVVAILVGLVWWGSRSLMLNLAQREGQARLRVAAQALDQRLDRVEQAGNLVETFWAQGRLPFSSTEESAALLMPWLSSQQEIQLLNLLDEEGRSLLLANNPAGWRAREIRLSPSGIRGLRWRDIRPDGRSSVLPPFAEPTAYDARRRGWYQEARRIPSPRWSTPYRLDPPESKLVVTWLHPLRGADGTLVGALGLDLPAQELQAFLDVLRPTPRSHLWVLDQNGEILSEAGGETPGRPKQGKPLLPSTRTHRILEAGLSAHAGAQWRMVLAIPEQDLLASVQGHLLALTGVATLLLAVPLVWGLRLGQRLAEDVQKLAHAAERLGPDQAPELPIQEVHEFQVLGLTLQRAHVAFQDHLRLQQQIQHNQRIETLGTLAGGIAHDVNNHLSAILGQLFLARQELTEGHPVERRLIQAEEAATRCARTTKTLLTFSQQDNPDLMPLDLNALIRGSADLIERALGSQVRIRLDLDPAIPRICGDPLQLELALTNLAINARDAMPEGGTLTLQTQLQPDGRVLLRVSDTGMGIPPDLLPRVFEPFFTTKPVGKGTGLGLSVVFGILEAHGGSVLAESHPGTGATFSLSFPAAPLMPTPSIDTEEREIPRGPLTGRRILVVEDEAYLRETLEEALSVAGATVQGANNGEEAWQLFQQGTFDCVLSDQRMPECTGAELLARIRATGLAIPFILTSGQNLDPFRPLLAADTGLTLLPKPFSIAQLMEHLEGLWNG